MANEKTLNLFQNEDSQRVYKHRFSWSTTITADDSTLYLIALVPIRLIDTENLSVLFPETEILLLVNRRDAPEENGFDLSFFNVSKRIDVGDQDCLMECIKSGEFLEKSYIMEVN